MKQTTIQILDRLVLDEIDESNFSIGLDSDEQVVM